MTNYFYLYQNRDKYSISTEKRYVKDIEALSKAVQNKRNLYYIGQTYLSMQDYENGYKYNLLSHEKEDDEDDKIGDHIEKAILCRIGYCALRSGKSKDIVFKYLIQAIENFKEPPIEAFIFLFSYAIEHHLSGEVVKYVKPLSLLTKPTGNDLALVNHGFYDYKRWNMISIICLLANQEIQIGRESCIKALKVSRDPTDTNNMQIYDYLSKNNLG